jgi:hypothetical protein
MAGEIRKPTRTSDDASPSPPNLIREPWRQEPDDPPNLHRLSTRQTMEENGIVELYERFATAGAHAPVRNEPAVLVPPSRRRDFIRKRKRSSAAKK